jgi:hypothetical protein
MMKLLALLKQWRSDGAISLDDYDTAVDLLMRLLYHIENGHERWQS